MAPKLARRQARLQRQLYRQINALSSPISWLHLHRIVDVAGVFAFGNAPISAWAGAIDQVLMLGNLLRLLFIRVSQSRRWLIVRLLSFVELPGMWRLC